MAIQNYSTVASRNNIRAEVEMLRMSEEITVLCDMGKQHVQPERKTDTVVFRRLNAFNAASNETPQITANDFIIPEGSVPDSYTIDYVDVSVTLQNYGVLFKMSSKSELMYEDDIPGDMVKQTGRVLGEIAEKVCYGQVIAGTSVIYAGGVSARASVASAITSNALRLAARTLNSNRATFVAEMVKPGPNFGTVSVDPSFAVLCSTDCESDLREQLPGFKTRVDYGSSFKPIHKREFGAWENFRFISSPLFTPWLAGGAAVGTTGLVAADDTNIDVYPYLVVAADAWGNISLKGKDGFSGIKPSIIPSSQMSHANPLQTYGFVGGSMWINSVRLNENFMVRIEAGITDLDA